MQPVIRGKKVIMAQLPMGAWKFSLQCRRHCNENLKIENENCRQKLNAIYLRVIFSLCFKLAIFTKASFTTTTKILQFVVFYCKLGILLC